MFRRRALFDLTGPGESGPYMLTWSGRYRGRVVRNATIGMFQPNRTRSHQTSTSSMSLTSRKVSDGSDSNPSRRPPFRFRPSDPSTWKGSMTPVSSCSCKFDRTRTCFAPFTAGLWTRSTRPRLTVHASGPLWIVDSDK